MYAMRVHASEHVSHVEGYRYMASQQVARIANCYLDQPVASLT
jgi:hypothetical protein